MPTKTLPPVAEPDYVVECTDARQYSALFGDGRRVPLPLSVTGVIKHGGLQDESVASYYTEESRQRGTELADAILDHVHGFTPTVSAITRPYWRQVQAFLLEGGFEIIDAEVRIGDPAMGYGGRLDLLGRLAKYVASEAVDLIDVKSGSVPRTVGCQTMAYRRRLRPNPVLVRRWALKVTPELYRLVPLNVDEETGWIDRVRDIRDEKLFLAALTVAQFRSGLYA